MERLVIVLISILTGVAIFSCKENDLEKQREFELKTLDEFIQNNYPDKEPSSTGLFYIETEAGVGDSINVGDKVQIFYNLMLLDSTSIASSGEFEPLELIIQPPTQLSSSASDVDQMPGLHEGLTYMKKGAKARFILPSQLAFGQYGTYGVGGFKTLLMDVEVYKVFPLEIPGE